MRIAVVIPTLNESANIAEVIRSLAPGQPDLIVVADCDSADDTADLARDAGAHVITNAGLRGRGAALQAGAKYAASHLPGADAVWFLHGDTLAPAEWRSAIEAVLADPAVVGGAFTQRFSFTPSPGETPTSWVQRRLLRFVIFCNRTRYRLTGIYFGDQGIFVRPDALARAGGVPQSPLMEDIDLCLALKRHGKLRVSPVKLSTSPRRFLKHGVIRQLLHDWLLLTTHRLGLRPSSLYAKYNADNENQNAASPV
ncbi:MAG: glycosyltransferase family 2 protein [Planctomycetota bacterium]